MLELINNADYRIAGLVGAVVLAKTLRNASYRQLEYQLHNYLKITGILNNVFRPQKQENKNKIIQHCPSQCCYIVVKLGLLKQWMPEE